jgi:hypothetical protein
MTGTPSRTARVSAARWSLKEAEGKSPAQGTRTVYEASVGGRGSVGVRSPKSSRTDERRDGGCGEKVTRLTLGDLWFCPLAATGNGAMAGSEAPACDESRRQTVSLLVLMPPGRPSRGLSSSRGGEMDPQKSAEGIRGQRSGQRPERANPNRYRGLDVQIRHRQ